MPPARSFPVTSGLGWAASIAFFASVGLIDGVVETGLGTSLSHQRYTPKPTTPRMSSVKTNLPRAVML